MNFSKEDIQGRSPIPQLSAEDITDIRCVNSEFYPGSRTAIHTLECEVCGVPDILTYEVSQNDDGESFSLHTGKNDIWDRMSATELRKLENAAGQEVEYYGWFKELENANTVDDVKAVRYGLWETESLRMNVDQLRKLHGMIDEKEEKLMAIQSDAKEKGQDKPSVLKKLKNTPEPERLPRPSKSRKEGCLE